MKQYKTISVFESNLGKTVICIYCTGCSNKTLGWYNFVLLLVVRPSKIDILDPIALDYFISSEGRREFLFSIYFLSN